MRILPLLLLFFWNCLQTSDLPMVRNQSGDLIGRYPKIVRWLGFQEIPVWKDLEVFSELEIIEFNVKDLNSLQKLPDFPKLRYINISESKVKDFSPFSRFPKLDTVILNGTPATDSQIKTFDGWNRLTRLEMVDSKISNLDFIGPSCSLKHLHLKNSLVKDLRPLSQCRNLQELYLRGTSVKDLSPLYGLSGMIHLQLDGTDVSDEEIRNIRINLPYLKIMPGLRKILSSETGLPN